VISEVANVIKNKLVGIAISGVDGATAVAYGVIANPIIPELIARQQGKAIENANQFKEELLKIVNTPEILEPALSAALENNRKLAASSDTAKTGLQKEVSSRFGDEKDVWNTGGINLNPASLDLQIKRDANWVPLPMDQQPILNMKIDGFSPVIINIAPVNVPLLLGFNDTVDPDCPSNANGAVNCSDSAMPINKPEEVLL